MIIVVVIFFLLILFSLANSCITREEFEDLSKLVYLEAGAESFEAQFAVASVVFNLRDAGYWGDSIEEVVYYPNAFSPASMIPDCVPNSASYEAVDYVIQNGSTLPFYVRYFRADKDHSWTGYKNYVVIDNVYFGYFENGNH